MLFEMNFRIFKMFCIILLLLVRDWIVKLFQILITNATILVNCQMQRKIVKFSICGKDFFKSWRPSVNKFFYHSKYNNWIILHRQDTCQVNQILRFIILSGDLYWKQFAFYSDMHKHAFFKLSLQMVLINFFLLFFNFFDSIHFSWTGDNTFQEHILT